MSALFPSLLNEKKSYTDKELEWFSFDTKETIEKQKAVKCKYFYEVISPENEVFITNNLKEFCRQKNLDDGHMYAIVNGKAKSHKGWTCKKL